MLGTLMKYEFKSVGRILLPLYGAWIIASLLLGLTCNTSSHLGEIVAAGSAFFYAILFAAVVVMTVVILIQRFYRNLLGNEGYCMFALPVSTGRHIFNKITSAAIWIILGIIVACLTAFAIAITAEGSLNLFHDNWEFFGLFLSDIADIRVIVSVIEVILIAILFCGEAAAKVYAAISIGHQIQNHRVLGAFGAYIAIAIAETIVASILTKIATAMGLTSLYYNLTSNMTGFALFQMEMLLVALAAAALLAIYWFVTWYLLKNRLNLE